MKNETWSSRRNFIRMTGIGTLAAGLPVGAMAEGAFAPTVQSSELFTIGVVGYSFKEYKDNIPKTIEVLTALKIKYVALKDFQLPYNSTQAHIDKVIGQFTAAGITVNGLGVIYMRSEKDIDNAFEYAKKTGVKMIVAAPEYKFLSYLEKKTKENNIRIAIHNHGPEDPLFPDIDSTYDKIKNMDSLMGICMDIGHTFRCGHDPAQMFLKYHDRVYDVHFKDEATATADSKVVNNGWGGIDFVAFVKALRKKKYSGMVGLENPAKEPLAMALAESIGHFRGILSAVKK